MRGRRPARSATPGLRLALLGVLVLSACAGGGVDRPEAPAPGGYRERGKASWYGPGFQGRSTASGERFDMNRLSAAHRSLPFGTVIRVHNLENGREIEVRVNDRGPFVRGRIVDLSRRAAEELGMIGSGVADVRLWVVAWPSQESAWATPQGASSTAAAVPATGGGVRVVQAGAFRDRARARRLARRIARVDGRARVYSSAGWHRVQVRGLDAGAARTLVERLAAEGIDAVVLTPD